MGTTAAALDGTPFLGVLTVDKLDAIGLGMNNTVRSACTLQLPRGTQLGILEVMNGGDTVRFETNPLEVGCPHMQYIMPVTAFFTQPIGNILNLGTTTV